MAPMPHTPITKFDRVHAAAIQDEMLAAAMAVANKYGFTIRAAGGTLGDIKTTLKFELTIADAKAVEAEERAEFNRYCGLFGLAPHHFGTTIRLNGKPLTLCGLAMSRRKYPLKFKDLNGKVTLYTEIVVDRVKAAATTVERVVSTKAKGE